MTVRHILFGALLSRANEGSFAWSPRQTKGHDPLREEKRMKARLVTLVALAAAVTLTAVAAAGPDAAKQRVANSMKGAGNGTFVLRPLQPGTLKRDSGTVSMLYPEPTTVMREGQPVDIYRKTYRLKGSEGPCRFASGPSSSGSRTKGPRLRFHPGCRHRHVEGRGRDRRVRRDHQRRTEWPSGPPVARAAGGLVASR